MHSSYCDHGYATSRREKHWLQHRVKLSFSFHIGLLVGVAYGRSDGSDVITNTKISGIDGLQTFVTFGVPRTRVLLAPRAPLSYQKVDVSNCTMSASSGV